MPSPSAIAWLSLLTARIVIGGRQPATHIYRLRTHADPRRARDRTDPCGRGAGGAHRRHRRRTTVSSGRRGRTRFSAAGGRDRLVGECGNGLLERRAGRATWSTQGREPTGSSSSTTALGTACAAAPARTSSTPTWSIALRRTASSSAAGCRAIRTRARRPSTSREVEPDSLTFGRTTVATFQVGRRFSGAADNIGFAVSSDNGSTWRSGLLPGLTRVSVPDRPERAGERSGRRVRRRQSRLADRDARARGPDHAPDRQPLDGRVHVERAGHGDRGHLAERNHLRQELDRMRQRRRPAPIAATATSSTPTRSGPTGSRRSPRSTEESRGRRRSGVPVTDAVGAFPVIRPSGELVVVYLWSGNRLGSSVSTDGALSFGPPSVIAELRFGRPAGFASSHFLRPTSILPDASGSRGTTAASAPDAPRTASSSRRRSTDARGPRRPGDDGTRRVPPGNRDPPDDRAGGDRLPRRSHGRNRRRAGRVAAGSARRRFATPRRLSAQTMRPEWSPNTVSGRMLADYLSVHYAGDRPLAVWILASEPVGQSLRQAVYATKVLAQSPIGCQTVFSSRNASISHGLCASADERTTRLTFSAASFSSSAVVPSAPVTSIALTSMCPASQGASSSRKPGEDVDRTAGKVGRRERLGQLDRRQRVGLGRNRDDRVAADEGRKDAGDEAAERGLRRSEDGDDTGGLRHGEVEVRAGDRVRAPEHLRQLVGPPRVPDDAVDRRVDLLRPEQTRSRSEARASIISASR